MLSSVGNRTQSKRPPGSVRIVGGEWRGRRLPVLDSDGLRPSGDRVRETLFNWLQPEIRGAEVIDLFAGSGALGLEAVSRGAGSAVLIELNPRIAASLRSTVETLASDRVQVVNTDAMVWLSQQPAASCDGIFVDPPFDSALQSRALEAIETSGVLRVGGWVYIESPRSRPAPVVGPAWLPLREKTLGDVRMQLLRKPA